MYKLEDFRKLVQKYSPRVDFAVIYLKEAHAVDGCALRNNKYSIKSHRNMEERLDAARMLFRMGLPCRLLVDTMENQAAHSLRALPERLVILADGRVAYGGARGPFGYDLDKLRTVLDQMLQ